MNKTKVDDSLLGMIAPKVKEIEEKFSRGEALRQEDINTLLLKSQFNHINHLNEKLEEVTERVHSLEIKFDKKFEQMESRFGTLEAKFALTVSEMKIEHQQAYVKMQDMMIGTMRWYIGGASVLLVLLKALDLFVN